MDKHFKYNVFIIFAILLLLSFLSTAQEANKELNTIMGFDFSRMEWEKFNDKIVIEKFGVGCGYEPNAPALRKHVFYDPKFKTWIQFDVIENDNWLVGIKLSKYPLCEDKKELKTYIIPQTSEGVKIGDKISKLEAIYGAGKEKNDTRLYRYTDHSAEVKIEDNIIVTIKVYSNYP